MIVITSFPILFSSPSRDLILEDPTTLYYFGTRNNPAVFNMSFADSIESVLTKLIPADMDGRVWWNTSVNAEAKFQSMLRRARELGVSIPDWSPNDPVHGFAHLSKRDMWLFFNSVGITFWL